MFNALKEIEIVRVCDGRQRPDVDRTAAEEPLEVRLHGRPFAVIMRTPGADLTLTAGFLLAERVLTSADDLATIEHCREQPRPATRAGILIPRTSSTSRWPADLRRDSNRRWPTGAR